MWSRRCEFCTDNCAELFTHLPFAEIPPIEDEPHVLVSFPRYHHLRLSLSADLKNHILRNEDHHKLFSVELVRKMVRYIKNIFDIRFPKKS